MIFLEQIINNQNFIMILLSAVTVSVAASMVGTIAIYKKKSILTGAVSNAVFIGVLVSFFTSNLGNIYVAYSISMLTALLCVFVISWIVKNSTIKETQVESFTTSFYFAIGLFIFTFIQRNLDTSASIGLERFLFGELFTMLESEAMLAIYVCLFVIFLVLIFLRRYKLILVDIDYAKSIGVNVQFYNLLFLLMLVGIIVVGLQTIGAVLMGGIFIAPAVCAKQWTNRLLPMVMLSAVIGGISGAVGGAISAFNSLVPSGPAIVAIASVTAMLSIFIAPKRGILWKRYKEPFLISDKVD